MSNPVGNPTTVSWLFAFVGVFLTAFIGYLIGALIEHPIGAGGFPFIGALIGVLIALDILILGEALKSGK